MKKLVKNLLLVVFVCCLCFGLASCKKKKSLAEKVADGDTINVAIIQYVSAPPLDMARAGIIEGLKDAGFEDGKNIKIDIFNCNEDVSTITQSVETAINRCDVIFAIATPVAQVVVAQLNKKGIEIPSFFTAVTDPVASGIMDSATNPSGSITGTSDLNQVAKQVAILKEMNPNAKKLGFIYSSSENNSLVQLQLAQEAAKGLGIEIVSQSVQSATEFKTVTETLINKGVDAIYLPTDNKLAANAKTVIDVANLKKVPTIAGESAFLSSGATLCYGSVNYTTLGHMTGEMAARVMKGEKTVATSPVEYFSSTEIEINKTASDAAGITLPQELLDKATIK